MNLSDAIMAYNRHRESMGIAHNTMRTQRRVLGLLLADVGNIDTKRLRHQHMDLFWSRRTTWGPNTRNLAAHTLRPFFDWCQARGYMRRDIDLLDGYRKARVPPRDRVVIPQSEFSTFIAGIRNPRARIACATGLYLFSRISETEGLRWQDLDTGAGTVQVCRHKTATLDTLPICSELAEEVERWRFTLGSQLGEPPLPGYFFIPAYRSVIRKGVPGVKGFSVATSPNGPIPHKRGRLGETMRLALEEAGYYQPGEGGHTLRRSGAIALYNELSSRGHDRAIRICQAMLGHSNIATTEVYLRLDLDRKVRNDLLAGKPMFEATSEAQVVSIGGIGVDGSGQASGGGIRV